MRLSFIILSLISTLLSAQDNSAKIRVFHPSHDNKLVVNRNWGYPSLKSDCKHYQDYFSQDFSKESQLLNDIRQALITGKSINANDDYKFKFDPKISQTYITLFQEGTPQVRWGSKRKNLTDTINRIVLKIRNHKRFSQFNVADVKKCRILFEVVQSSKSVKLNSITYSRLTTNRFEPGITGIKCQYKKKLVYYMPTDATILSHLSANHLLNYLAKKLGVNLATNKISKRVQSLKIANLKCSLLTSKAFITFGNQLIPLYRGQPAKVQYSKKNVKSMTMKSIEWMVNNMNKDGSFLYYYDPIRDTIIDHAHPGRTLENNYNNILRHCGGTITLLRAYEISNDKKYLVAAKQSILFLIKQLKKRTINGKIGYYAFFNEKAKLGGTGIALVAVMRYGKLSGDDSFASYATGMVYHLLSRIEEDGEMIGYYIHPQFNDGKPIIAPNMSVKKMLFSFYYPGEALLGLAEYDKKLKDGDALKKELRYKSKKALDFLVNIRPKRYASMFTSLPADSWLMQAIEEWSKDKEFQKEEYYELVFNDAKAMRRQMYDKTNSPYYDYPGTFFYDYGDVSYPDGCRGEGLISAYFLAKRLKREKLANGILASCTMVAKSLFYTHNSKASSYMHKDLEKSLNTFRFKFTRQWIRVDSIQHTACFYVRMLDTFASDK